jgi:hypothetical protein
MKQDYVAVITLHFEASSMKEAYEHTDRLANIIENAGEVVADKTIKETEVKVVACAPEHFLE